MDNKKRPEENATFKRELSLKPLDGTKAAGEERDMHAIANATSQETTQQSISFVGWGITFFCGALIWALVFLLI